MNHSGQRGSSPCLAGSISISGAVAATVFITERLFLRLDSQIKGSSFCLIG